MVAAEQIRIREADTRTTPTDGSQRILAEQRGTTHSGADQRTTTAADSARMVQSNVLPDTQIVGHDTPAAPQESGFMHWVHGAEAVATDLARGAVDEIVHHPGQVIGSALTGLAVGTVAVLAAPEIAIAAAVAGAGYGAYQLATHVGGWVHSADVVSNTQDHTAAEVAAAHRDLQGVGAGGVLIGAGVIGSLGAAPLAGAITEAASAGAASTASAAEGGTVTDVLVNAVRSGRYEAVESNGITILRPVGGTGAVGAEAGTAAAGAEAGTVTAGAEGATAATAEATAEGSVAAAERVPLTPEQVAINESVARSQSLFQTAGEQGQIVPSVKQLYQVRFERVGPGGQTIPTIENPAGIQVPEGNWIATRLNADGTPNVENGIMNRWTPSVKDITSKYLITPEQLAASNGDITGFTNTAAAPVHMIRLEAPTTIQTEWGPMTGQAGDWLANYNYNTATGVAGDNYAIVSSQSYRQTYQPHQ
ncbi:MAG: hypothetical protein JST89_13140 [Cyanobacteria bacterium SZAS-4]|nr:hypothetical protein [Cyanobacteria bacterium SZAS-4]